MEGYNVQPGTESLESRIRRMAVSNGGTQNRGGYSAHQVMQPQFEAVNGPPSIHPPSFPAFPGHTSPENQQGSLSISNTATFDGQHYQPIPSSFPAPHQHGHRGQYVHPPGMPMTRERQHNSNYNARGRHFGGFRGGGGQQQYGRQHVQVDPDAYMRGTRSSDGFLPPRHQQTLFDPAASRYNNRSNRPNFRERQAQYLDGVASQEISSLEMSAAERCEKEDFRKALEQICHELCDADQQRLPKVSLECFGSFQSGFASAGSDMDLVIVVNDKDSESACFSLLEHDLPRALEKRLLQLGIGARLLTRTRVPIIKLCQKPGVSLLDRLREEREKWDFLPNEKKYPHLHPEESEDGNAEDHDNKPQTQIVSASTLPDKDQQQTLDPNVRAGSAATLEPTDTKQPVSEADLMAPSEGAAAVPQQSRSKAWTRERTAGPLDFPKTGVGIQSDINFFNPLGLHNTKMLRCYSLCDSRVRPMILFVKAWVKRRKINSSYSGTLSSYGYVLMVLHYLVNIARPPVLPNLQLPWRPHPNCTPQGATATEVDGWTVDFWQNEDEIIDAAQRGLLATNQESLGSLLAGFFQYYSSLRDYQYRWTHQVLSLRTLNGIISKDQKGWVKATTEAGEGKKIQHRYLFCIEDPFELTHNVARTVTHNGIVAIRDEFRRAFHILQSVANGTPSHYGNLFDVLVEEPEKPELPPDLRRAQAAPGAQNFKFGKSSASRPGGVPPGPSSRKPTSDGLNHRASQSKAFDVADNDAFPALGTAKSKASKNSHPPPGASANFGEISGDRAKAYLEGLKKKKTEEEEG